ncbi:MAG: hypothetical protein A2516_11165 [Alphaproteobacteria bacterium RIFOXYD12_FULL_60_8]|nr:MAG: hypothetical protein A2516_11165 [Alphaproteobacteria bacterium RIFOXYD12_FULL_60_8]
MKPAKQKMGKNAPKGLAETADFSRRALTAIAEEISEIRGMQAQMAEEVSRYVRHIGDDLGESTASHHLRQIVAATQAEDHIRQKQEHVLKALTAIDAALNGLLEGGVSSRHDMAHRLLETLTLGRVRDRFARTLLDTPVPSSAPPPAQDDIELF